MKFDHFTKCPYLSDEARNIFDELKKEDSKKPAKVSKAAGVSSSTAQYYHDSACSLGMVDGKPGVFVSNGFEQHEDVLPEVTVSRPAALVPLAPKPAVLEKETLVPPVNLNPPSPARAAHQALVQQALQKLMLTQKPPSPSTEKFETACCLLTCSEDPQHLNDLHCFVRRHIEVFAANETDITTPSPGRKERIHLGQVGLRCVHCTRLPFKQRVKRAVCYPPSISGIYHAVSNMKHDHFARCKGLSASERNEFLTLRACSRKRTSSSSSTTARYYQEAAMDLGLVDTEHGMRFRIMEGAVMSDGMTALVMAATDPSVRAAYEAEV
jgi:hypothetical protein